MLKKSVTQVGIFKYIEEVLRSHPLSYLLAREFCNIFGIFEADAKGLKNIVFNEDIVCVDVGASDGIFLKFLKNNKFKLKKAFCFEPNNNYVKKLKKLKKINLEIFDYGLGLNNKVESIFFPYYRIFNKSFFLETYTFGTKEDCEKQVSLDFRFKKNIFIEEQKINISKNYTFDHKINLIKIDINGNELDIIRILESVIKKDRPVIYLENNYNISEIINILSNYEYTPYIYDSNNNSLKIYENEEVLNLFFINKQFKFKSNL